jgi:hypothetical protein
MARSPITDTSSDINTDSGAVLWSVVKGEQLEFPITMNFVTDATVGYQYEAVVVEALNVSNQTERPTAIKPSGVQTVLTVRVPTNRGTWQAVQAYNQEEVVLYNNIYYRLISGAARVSSTLPNVDPYWAETTLNKIYVQFMSSLGNGWSIQPTSISNTYGFFELRVTEVSNSIFARTWKPIRGMVEVLFSPTDIVP